MNACDLPYMKAFQFVESPGKIFMRVKLTLFGETEDGTMLFQRGWTPSKEGIVVMRVDDDPADCDFFVVVSSEKVSIMHFPVVHSDEKKVCRDHQHQ
jgi:hypothetical protein